MPTRLGVCWVVPVAGVRFSLPVWVRPLLGCVIVLALRSLRQPCACADVFAEPSCKKTTSKRKQANARALHQVRRHCAHDKKAFMGRAILLQRCVYEAKGVMGTSTKKREARGPEPKKMMALMVSSYIFFDPWYFWSLSKAWEGVPVGALFSQKIFFFF